MSKTHNTHNGQEQAGAPGVAQHEAGLVAGGAAADAQAQAGPVSPATVPESGVESTEQEKLKRQWTELARQKQEFANYRDEQERAFTVYQEEEARKTRKRLDDLWREQSARLLKELETLHADRLAQAAGEAEEFRKAQHLRDEALREKNARELEEEFAKKRALLKAELEAAESRHREKLAEEDARREKAAQRLKQQEDELNESRVRLEKEHAEAELQVRQTAVIRHTLEAREKELQAAAEKLAESRVAVIQAQLDSNREALQRANAESRKLQDRINAYETLANRLGGREPEEILHELSDRQMSLDKLREELARRPPQELKAHYEELERREKEQVEKLHQYRELVESMRSENERLHATEIELGRERQEKEKWKQLCEGQQTLNDQLEEELRRLKSQYGKNQERDDRIRAVEMPYINEPPALMAVKPGELDETEWLDSIENSCRKHHFKFPRRILNAFHTSLKVSEWSPITVLAGVSGTGKSELPRLYSLFGGLNFMSLPVQPNWDSQESMLGFFNTIDNVFDAQPVLRFLAQSCKNREEGYPGLTDAVNLILLDEMNLAHIELYFAEFLSKLELRRGRARSDVPDLEVKLGAHMEPYKIRLQRNILFAGTMNQDETTKSLSDKVLDRSGIIHFPRPRVLERRSKLKESRLPAMPAALLPHAVWRKWVEYDTAPVFTDDEVRPYKNFIQGINGALEVVGRALGHRVWQSVEAYMANHPDVRAARARNEQDGLSHALHVAFEDQLVQKVMPKLRGIETRGNARTRCLDTIAQMLSDGDYGIVKDFHLACETGYGQFTWNSANYLDEAGAGENMESAPAESDIA